MDTVQLQLLCAGLCAALAYLVWHLMNVCSYETLPAGEAAMRLWQYWRAHPAHLKDIEGLPKKLRGVFWMSDNSAPELCVCFEAGALDAAKRTLMFKSYGAYNWTVNADCIALVFLFAMRPFTSIQFEWNEDYTFAEMPFHMLGLIRTPSLMRFTIRQLDDAGLEWARDTYLAGKKWDYGSYTLRRVVDENGKQLPAFREMMEQVESGVKVKGTTTKTKMQRIPSYMPCFKDVNGPEVDDAGQSKPLMSQADGPPLAARAS